MTPARAPAPDLPPFNSRHAWLDHPRIAAHYRLRALIDGLGWEPWVAARQGGSAANSLQLGCGAGTRSFLLFENRWAARIDGIDASEDQILAAGRSRDACRAPGAFRVADLNSVSLPRGAYDLIFACHSLHHVVALEKLMDQVEQALTPSGVFVVEGFVGPSRFQWSDKQMAMVRLAAAWLPESLRMFRWGVPKTSEAPADRAAVAAISPFESIRSAEIVSLFNDRFEMVARRPLGGTIQHLLYNGIIHNFADDDAAAVAHLARVWELEDCLTDAGLLPSDFMLLIGQRRPGAVHAGTGHALRSEAR